MKVLLVNGSMKPKGCTYTALTVIQEELAAQGVESDIFQIGTEAIKGCMGCGACAKLGKCITEDAVNKALAMVDSYDGFIFGSPVHYAAASGAVTSFLDRFFYASHGRMAHKPGAVVVSCRRGGASAAFDQLNKYFSISQMPIISSCYWNQVHGNTPEEVMQDLEGIRTIRVLARNMAYQLKLQQLAKDNGITYPEELPAAKTNFIR